MSVFRVAAGWVLIFLFGCQSAEPVTGGRPPGMGAPELGAVAVAMVDGRVVRWEDLRPLLAEAAGGAVLSEWVLDLRLERELERAGLAVRQEDLENEKQQLIGQLHEDPVQARRLLQELRDERGLGENRFRLLLRRNASLRKLVQGEVVVDEPMLRQSYEQEYGRKVQVRLILVRTLEEAAAVRRRLDAGESFEQLADLLSLDASGRLGGLLAPFSARDPAYPRGLRERAIGLEPGQISDPVLLDSGFAILRCERKIDSVEVPYEQVVDGLRQRLRLQQERIRMEQKARLLIQEAQVTVLDAAMGESWKVQKRRIAREP